MNVSELLSDFLVANTSKVSKWYVDSMLKTDLRRLIELANDADRDELEFEDVMTRVKEVFDTEKLMSVYNVIGMILEINDVRVGDKKEVDDLVTRGNMGYVKTGRSKRDVTLENMRDTVSELLRSPVSRVDNDNVVAIELVIGNVEKPVSSVDVLNNRLDSILDSSKARLVKSEKSTEISTEDKKETTEVYSSEASVVDSLTDVERELLSDGYVRTYEKDDLGKLHSMWSKSFDRYVTGYMGMKEVCEALGKSEPYIKRIARMIGAVTIRNRFYADEKLVERVRSELVAIKKIGNGYMSMTDFALAANMTRRGATRVVRTKLDYKERNTNLFVKRSAANKFIRENAEQVPNPFEYVTVREIEYATGFLITSEYSDSDSMSSGLSLKYRNNRMILMSELLRMLEVKGKLDTFNVKVRNELLLDYMSGYLEMTTEDEKRDFRKEAGVYGRYLQNMDDLENPKQWLKEMLVNEEYMTFAKVLETSIK